MSFVVRWSIASALLAVISTVAIAENTIDWHEYYEHAVEEAQRTGKPIFMAFRCAP